MSLDRYLRAAPKAELHVHLEGSIRPATLLMLAERNGVSLPTTMEAGLRAWFTYRDFDHFIAVYVACTQCLRTAEDYELVVYEFGAEMARQNVRYAEVTFSPSTNWVFGVPQEVWFPGLTQGRARMPISAWRSTGSSTSCAVGRTKRAPHLRRTTQRASQSKA